MVESLGTSCIGCEGLQIVSTSLLFGSLYLLCNDQEERRFRTEEGFELGSYHIVDSVFALVLSVVTVFIFL